jgi:hypothetical protein
MGRECSPWRRSSPEIGARNNRAADDGKKKAAAAGPILTDDRPTI